MGFGSRMGYADKLQQIMYQQALDINRSSQMPIDTEVADRLRRIPEPEFRPLDRRGGRAAVGLT